MGALLCGLIRDMNWREMVGGNGGTVPTCKIADIGVKSGIKHLVTPQKIEKHISFTNGIEHSGNVSL